MLDNGMHKTSVKVKEHSIGLMDLSMLDIGKMIWQMERED